MFPANGQEVEMLRRQLAKHRAFAVLAVACALLTRLIVPAGFMPVFEHGTVSIVLCSGYGPQTVQMDMPGMDMSGAGHNPNKHHDDKTNTPCPFSGLTAPVLSGADPTLLIAAILFIMVLVSRVPDRQPVRAYVRLRPPLRGPPFRI
jgi:hypothetical protein